MFMNVIYIIGLLVLISLSPYTHVKHGMVIDKHGKLHGTTTLVHTNPMNGRQYFGQSRIDK